jgi:hypothetical protein
VIRDREIDQPTFLLLSRLLTEYFRNDRATGLKRLAFSGSATITWTQLHSSSIKALRLSQIHTDALALD